MQQPLNLREVLGRIHGNHRTMQNLMIALALLFSNDDKVNIEAMGKVLARFIIILPRKYRVCDAINSALMGRNTAQEAWVAACSEVGCLPVSDPQWRDELNQLICLLRAARTEQKRALTLQEVIAVLSQ